AVGAQPGARSLRADAQRPRDLSSRDVADRAGDVLRSADRAARARARGAGGDPMIAAAHKPLDARFRVIYWLTLVGGLALFGLTRSDDAATTATLAVGAIGGTALGHYLAARH